MINAENLKDSSGTKPVGTFLLLTVKGDIHDIGKDLVRVMLEGTGFQVIDLGVNVEPEEMIVAIREHRPQIVGFSAFFDHDDSDHHYGRYPLDLDMLASVSGEQ
ncbi:MAG: hypothetical protein GY796_01265 [Chloroflexi bacterium]|nr:hypothetical protein [Chloroflexota bacterium]